MAGILTHPRCFVKGIGQNSQKLGRVLLFKAANVRTFYENSALDWPVKGK